MAIINGTSRNDTLNGSAEDDVLQGLGGNDRLFGFGGNDLLDGGDGDDRMEGGAGNDIYVVGSVGDRVTEASTPGIDTVQASISYVLNSNVENLLLTGANNLNGTGNALANLITGNSGNNLLDGGAGNDTMAGGIGDDIYVVAQAGDSVSEAEGEGVDTVRSSISYTLGANVENLELTGGAILAGTGNSLNNRLSGNSASNTLDGGAGNDWLAGRAGNDTYRYGLNYGNDVIDNTLGDKKDIDTLALTGLNTSDVRFVRSGSDLVMTVLVNAQTLTVQGFYLSADHEIDQVIFANGTTWNNATLKAAVSSGNTPPTSTNDSVTTLEDTPVVLSVSDFGTYSDLENNALAAVKITALPAAGSLQYNDAGNNAGNWVAVTQDQIISKAALDGGQLRFVPDANASGTSYASVGFMVSDGTDFALSASTLTVNVTPVNDAPVAVADTLSATEDTPVTFTAAQLLGNDTDVDSALLSIASVTSGTGGTVVLNLDGTVSFTPTAGFNGAAGFSYTASDGATTSNAAAVTVNVDAGNDAPIFKLVTGSGKVTTDIGLYDAGYSVAVQPDGKIVVAGSSFNGSNTDFAVVRYNSDGSLDTSFNGDGKLTTSIGSADENGNSVVVQPDGKIVVAGYSNTAGYYRDIAVVRYLANLRLTLKGSEKVFAVRAFS